VLKLQHHCYDIMATLSSLILRSDVFLSCICGNLWVGSVF